MSKKTKNTEVDTLLFKEAENKIEKTIASNINDENKICPCGVKITTKKKSDILLDEGLELYEYKLDKKVGIYKRCERSLYNEESYCYKHLSTSMTTPNNLIIWEDILKNGNKLKKVDKFKNQIETRIPLRINSEMLEDLEKIYNDIKKCSIVCEIQKESTFKEEQKNERRSRKSKTKVKQEVEEDITQIQLESSESTLGEIQLELNNDDLSEIEDDLQEEINVEHELAEDEASCIEIPTKTGEVLYLEVDSNIVYKLVDNVEDGGEEIGKLHKVNDDIAPIYRDENNYIVGNKKTINNEEYIVCALSSRVYKDRDFKGILKVSSRGTMTIKR